MFLMDEMYARTREELVLMWHDFLLICIHNAKNYEDLK
jgi:hypothetical protein